MDGADSLLGDFAAAAGDKAPAPPGLKREHDSSDDFEHLEAERRATQGLLAAERGAPADPAPSLLDRITPEPVLADRYQSEATLVDRFSSEQTLADRFTDSESDDTAGESPLHRALPPQPAELALPLTPRPAPPAVPEPAPQAPTPEPPLLQPAPAPAPAPAPPPQEPPKPKPSAPAPAPPKEARAPVAHVIEAEVIFCQMGLVESLLYWRDAARSGAALGAGLALLVALACCSVVSVLAYAALLALSAAVAFRVYRNVLQAVQKTNEGHPFKWLLEQDISVSAERAQSLAAGATAHLNAALAELRRLFLVEDLVDSLKFGVLLWCLTYVGAYFNGITLIILGWIALFTLPKAYELNKAQVDANLELARAKINEISSKVRAAVPLGRKAESEKDK